MGNKLQIYYHVTAERRIALSKPPDGNCRQSNLFLGYSTLQSEEVIFYEVILISAARLL